MDGMVRLSHKDGEKPLKTEGKTMTTATATKIDEAVLLVIAEGDCAVPQYNDFGGVDLWTVEQTGYTTAGRGYFAEGVRIWLDDETIQIIKFEGKGLVACTITVSGYTSVELLAQIIKRLL